VDPAHPRRFRYSLRALLIVVALFAAGFALIRANRGSVSVGSGHHVACKSNVENQFAVRTLITWLQDNGFDHVDGPPPDAAFTIRRVRSLVKQDGSTQYMVQFYSSSDHGLHVHLSTSTVVWPLESTRVNDVAHTKMMRAIFDWHWELQRRLAGNGTASRSQ
jgi:hypothetical protein